MSVLVTGGAGYIGSVAVEKLLAAGESVVVLDNLSQGHKAAIASDAIFVRGDILDGPLVRSVLAEYAVDTVMHFAAFIVVPESCAQPLRYFENNVFGAETLLHAMVDAGVGRFIFSSTAAVYGDPVAMPIAEDHPKNPLNPYGLSKWMVEQILQWCDQAHGLRYCALRYFNACGATRDRGEAHDPETHLIPNIILAAEGKRPNVTVFGTDYPTPDGTCVRDYIHIEDLVDAHLKAMQYLRAGGASDAFNLGNSIGFSVNEVIETVRAVTGCDFTVRYEGRRPGDADRLIASSDKARRVLGWNPRKGDIETIVRDAWAWRRTHEQGYDDREDI